MFRAQSEGGVPVPPSASGSGADAAAGTGSFAVPGTQAPSTWNAFSPPINPDPFVTDPAYGGAAPYAPYTPYGPGAVGSPYGGSMNQPFSTYGTGGMQPYRQGWMSRLEMELLPATDINQPGRGEFEQFGVDYDLAVTGPFLPGWMFTWTNQFRLRNWEGPDGVTPGAGLPGKAFRFGVDLELETPQAGPVSLSLGINPSINTDLDASPGSASFQLDGRGMFIFQLDQSWSLVLGAAFWDRVDDRVIPYGGLVYRDDLWEWRIMYPESTISLFLGNGAGGSMWMYVRAEYRVEGYEIRTTTGTDEVELEDYRALLGIRTDNGTSSWFIEGGWVFDRNVEYDSPVNASFEPDTGFIVRTGWRY
ncbi:MAG: hypothetical protein RIK87_06225 [Fuerstiella sp.]